MHILYVAYHCDERGIIIILKWQGFKFQNLHNQLHTLKHLSKKYDFFEISDSSLRIIVELFLNTADTYHKEGMFDNFTLCRFKIICFITQNNLFHNVM